MSSEQAGQSVSFDSVQTNVLHLVGSPWVFVAVAAVLAIGSIVVFLPSQGLVVAVGSLLLAKGNAFPGTADLVVVAAAGMLIGDIGLFALVRKAHPESHSWLHSKRVQSARKSLEFRYSKTPTRIAVLGRFIPVGRLTTNLIAGDSGSSFTRFVIASAIADVVWAVYCVAIAAAFGSWGRENAFLVTVLAVIVSIVLGFGINAIERAITRRRTARR